MWDRYEQEIVNDVSYVRPIQRTILMNDASVEVERLSIGNIEEVYSLMRENYTCQEGVKIVYSKEAILFFLTCLGNEYKMIGIRNDGELVGFACGVKRVLRIGSKIKIDALEVNFLCVKKCLRGTLLHKALVDEMTRENVCIGYASRNLPNALSEMVLYAFPINISRLIEAGYFELPEGNSVGYYKALEERFRIRGNAKLCRRVRPRDIMSIYELFREYYQDKVHFEISIEILTKMMENKECDMFCANDLRSVVCLYRTTETRNCVEVEVGNVYLFCLGENGREIREEIIGLCKGKYDLLVFPENYVEGNERIFRYNNLNFHMVGHSSIWVDRDKNYMTVF